MYEIPAASQALSIFQLHCRPSQKQPPGDKKGALQAPARAEAALPAQSRALRFAETGLRNVWKHAKYLHGIFSTAQCGKGKPSRKSRQNDWKGCGELQLPEFLPQQRPSLRRLKCICGSEAPGSPLWSGGEHTATRPCPILPLSPQDH